MVTIQAKFKLAAIAREVEGLCLYPCPIDSSPGPGGSALRYVYFRSVPALHLMIPRVCTISPLRALNIQRRPHEMVNGSGFYFYPVIVQSQVREAVSLRNQRGSANVLLQSECTCTRAVLEIFSISRRGFLT